MAGDYPKLNDPGPSPLIRQHASPGTLERRAANAEARKRGDKLMPYFEDDAERFELLLAELTAIRRDVADFVGAHRAPGIVAEERLRAACAGMMERAAVQVSTDPPDEAA